MFLSNRVTDMTNPDMPPPHPGPATGTGPVYSDGGLAENGPARIEEARN